MSCGSGFLTAKTIRNKRTINKRVMRAIEITEDPMEYNIETWLSYTRIDVPADYGGYDYEPVDRHVSISDLKILCIVGGETFEAKLTPQDRAVLTRRVEEQLNDSLD